MIVVDVLVYCFIGFFKGIVKDFIFFCKVECFFVILMELCKFLFIWLFDLVLFVCLFIVYLYNDVVVICFRMYVCVFVRSY